MPSKRPAHDLWAVLIARIYEVFPLLCPLCGGQMRLIAFVTHSADIRQILEHIGVESEPPHIAPAWLTPTTPARGPPLWDGCDAQAGEGFQIEPDWAIDCDGAAQHGAAQLFLSAQPAPHFEVDQRVNG